MEKQNSKLGCRVILLPHPYVGHTTPMFNLGNALYSKGFSIDIIQTRLNSYEQTAFPNFTFHYMEGGQWSLETLVSSFDPWEAVTLLNKSFSAPFRESLAQVLEAATKDPEPVACLISDPIWDFAGTVADEFYLPRLALRTGGLLAFALYESLPLLRQKGYFSLQEMENSQGIICNTFEELEDFYIARVHQVLPIPIFALGPIHKNSPSSQASIWTQDHTSISWLDTQAPKSVLYVSFGSMVQVSKADFVEIACGLANSKQPFLWVVRHGSIEGSDETDPLPLPEGYSDTIGQRGNIVNWAPQQEVLAHPAVGGFWTHCGWNSIMESISEGVPMLCLPFFADQNINTRHVSDHWRIGMELDKGIKRGEIERAIRKLMVEEEGEAMRNRITALKEKATLSVMEGGSSYKSLENLTNYLLSSL